MIRGLARQARGAARGRRNPGRPQQLGELYEVRDAWPIVASPFPEPFVFRPEGVDRAILDLDPRWAGRPVTLPPVVVHDLPGAAIRAEGIVQTPEGTLLLESVKRAGHLFRSPERHTRPRSVHPREGVGTTIVLAGRVANYFHWVVDMLPRLYALEQHAAEDKIELVVPDGLPAFAEELLARVVRPPFRVVRCPPDDAFSYDTVRLATFTTTWSHGLMRPEITAWVRDRLVGALPASGPADRRIFVRRIGTRARSIDNETELLIALEPFGIEPIRPETLSLEGQLALFSDAALIVGACGAGLTNMIASTDAIVVDINPGGCGGMPSHPSFWSLAHSAGHRYAVVPHACGLHVASFAVDVDRVVAAVTSALDLAATWRSAIF